MKQPKPDPAIVKAQMDAQEGAAKIQSAAQAKQLDAQTTVKVEQIKAQTLIQTTAMTNATNKEIAQAKIAGDAQISVFEAQHNLREEALQLDAKAAKVELASNALKVQSDLTGMAQEHVQKIGTDLATQNDQRIETREQAIVAQLNDQVMAGMQQIGASIASLAPLLQQIAALNAQTVEELKKPKAVSLGGIKTDASGKITSATVSTTPVTVQ